MKESISHANIASWGKRAIIEAVAHPDEVICSDVEGVTGFGVQPQDVLHPVGFGRDDLGNAVGVVDLGSDSILVHQLADGDEPAGGADQCVVWLARADLLRGGGADVEPDRGVEGEDLVDQRV
jgi:hypothetical protein